MKKAEKSNIPTSAELAERTSMPLQRIDNGASSRTIMESTGKPVNVASRFGAYTSNPKSVKILSLPPILKPSEIEVGQVFEGVVVEIMPSPVKGLKGDIMILEHPNGQFGWPANAVTAVALARYQTGTGDATEKDFDPKKAIGLHLQIMGMGMTRTQNVAPNGERRTVRLFEIAVLED